MVDFSGTYYIGLDDNMFGNGSTAARPLDSFAEAAVANAAFHQLQGIDVAAWSPPCNGNTYNVANKTRPYASVQWLTVAPPFHIRIDPDSSELVISGLAVVANADSPPALDFEIEVVIVGFGRARFTMANTAGQIHAFRWSIPIHVPPTDAVWTVCQIFGQSQIGDNITEDGVGVLTGNNVFTNDTGWTATSLPGASITTAANEVRCIVLRDAADNKSYFDSVKLWQDTAMASPFMVVSPFSANQLGAGAYVDEAAISYVQFFGMNFQQRWRTE